MRTVKDRKRSLVATSHRPGLAGDGRSRTLCCGIWRSRCIGACSWQCCPAARGLGGRAPGVVPEGGWAGGGGLARPAAPIRGEKVCFRSGGGASHGARALRFLRTRGRLFGPWRASGERAPTDAHRRCHYPRPHASSRRPAGYAMPSQERRFAHSRSCAHWGRAKCCTTFSTPARARYAGYQAIREPVPGRPACFRLGPTAGRLA